MFIVDSYFLAVMLCVVTMFCWGSWGNTQKLAGKKWRYELFYWDYTIGILLFSIVMAFTLGSIGSEGRGFVEDLLQADRMNLGSALLGGIIFNASNILLSASISIAGMAVAFPLGVGLALVFGVCINYFSAPKGDPVILFLGVLLIVVAIVLNGIAAGKHVKGGQQTTAKKGIVLAAVAGILMSLFFRFVASAMDLDHFEAPTAGMITPYTAFFIFSAGIFLSNFLFNTVVMRKPFVGEPVGYGVYFKGSLNTHMVGILGGCVWSLGTLFSYIAAGKAGAAISYALGQGAPMIAAAWGIFIWKEFKGSSRLTNLLLTLMFILFISGLGLIVLAGKKGDAAASGTRPVLSVIFETDMGNDVDDALALDMLYKYKEAGQIRFLAMSTNKKSECSAGYLDIMNTWYGHTDIPIGVGLHTTEGDNQDRFVRAACELQKDGRPAFARTVKEYSGFPLSVPLYRKTLAAQPDASVVIISVGFSTNLAQLLDSPADAYSPLTGKELVAKKVVLLSTMMGGFEEPGFKEFNVKCDIPAAQKVINEWPTDIVASPFEVGNAILYPAASIRNDFTWADPHPLVVGYENYLPMPYDRQTWDLTSVLYAVEKEKSFFGTSVRGTITITDDAVTHFTPDPAGRHSYLTVTPDQAAAIRQYFIHLITQRPAKYPDV